MGALGFFNQADGKVQGVLGGSRIVVSPTTIFQATDRAITAIDRAKLDEKKPMSPTAALAAQRWKVDLTRSSLTLRVGHRSPTRRVRLRSPRI